MDLASKEWKKLAILKAIIQNEKKGLLDEIEALLERRGISIKEENENVPMSFSDFKAGIDQSIDDFKNGRFATHDEFGEMIKGWGTK